CQAARNSAPHGKPDTGRTKYLRSKRDTGTVAGAIMKQSTRWLGLSIGLVFLLGVRGLFAADWPQWRGPQRNGISQEAGLLKEWPAGGPKLLWQLKDIGSGF